MHDETTRLVSRPTRIVDGGDDRYECYHCGHRFDQRRQTCPRCDGAHVDRSDWLH